MQRNIYCFWTGTNPMNIKRKRCLENLIKNSECNVILVTPNNLNNYILKDHPLHEAYQYLSAVHKADYLRTYFMNFIGGGYSDIKNTTGSWIESFDKLYNSDKLAIGYKELPGGSAYCPTIDTWKVLIGNGAYIFKPNTEFTNKWYNEMIKLLDSKLEELKKNPASNPRDYFGFEGSKYPLEWNEMLGRIFHRISFGFRNKYFNTLPKPIFKNFF